MTQIWEEAKKRLKETMASHIFQMWIAPLTKTTLADQTLTIFCPNGFSKKWNEDHYATVIANAVGNDLKIVFSVEEKASSKTPINELSQKQLSIPKMNASSFFKFRPEFTLKNFYIGNFNQLPYNAILNLTKGAPSLPIFLLSDPGLGKTHLMQAIAVHCIGSSIKVTYVTASDFCNDVVIACKNGGTSDLQKRYSEIDILLVDDAHNLGGKNRTQMDLSQITEKLLNNGKRIVFSSILQPDEIEKIDAQLRSRFSGSMLFKITPPEFDDRIMILRKKMFAMKKMAVNVDNEAIEFLAEKLTGDIRILEASFLNLITRASLCRKNADLELAKEVIVFRKKITVELIMKTVAEASGIPEKVFLSSSREQKAVNARRFCFHLMKEELGMTLKEIEKELGRNHSSIIHALKRTQDSTFLKEIELIKKQLTKNL
ncbi:MAG TPA: DnaA/Hda family protein [Candidatus Moranbacteria bacterium]|nr:DnaA/Hda family protein [Candidatus Moranbacteria bacterium]